MKEERTFVVISIFTRYSCLFCINITLLINIKENNFLFVCKDRIVLERRFSDEFD